MDKFYLTLPFLSIRWSYGVVLYEISTIGGSPYPQMESRKIANLLQQGYRMPKPEHVGNDLYQIMMNCWQSEPETRPSFSDLTQQLKRMENQHKSLINMHIYDNTLYANLEDLNAWSCKTNFVFSFFFLHRIPHIISPLVNKSIIGNRVKENKNITLKRIFRP